MKIFQMNLNLIYFLLFCICIELTNDGCDHQLPLCSKPAVRTFFVLKTKTKPAKEGKIKQSKCTHKIKISFDQNDENDHYEFK